MVTKVIKINGTEIALNDNYRKIVTAYGKSTDEKGTSGYKNADIFYEMDTQKVYLYDQDGATWIEQ